MLNKYSSENPIIKERGHMYVIGRLLSDRYI